MKHNPYKPEQQSLENLHKAFGGEL